MSKIVKLLMGTNKINRDRLLTNNFNELSWWSDNLETVAHYYEGSVVEITIKLDLLEAMEYVREFDDFKYLNISLSEYTYGFAEVRYPKGAIWYSFNGEYLKRHVTEVREIYPDLSQYES